MSRPRILAIAAVTALALSGLAVTPAFADTLPATPATPVTVAADALPTPQINGVVWSQVVVGDIVYVAGSFTAARPFGSAPGANTVTRNNLLAYNIETGVLVPGFAPSLNAQALAVTASPDGSRVYVAGDFTSIDGVGYYRIAAFNTATGQVIPTFKPILGSQGRALQATNSTVYVGGTFRTVSGSPRDYLASINAATGAVTPWIANTNAVVDAIALTKDGTKIVAGGRFTTLAGAAFRGLGAVNATTGVAMPWPTNAVVRNAGTNASITSLVATEDAVYGTGYAYGKTGGNFEGTFSANPATGALNWLEDCHGDSYSSFPLGDAVYVASHSHYCGNIGGFPQTDPWTMHYATAFTKARTGTVTKDPHGYWNFQGNPAPTLLNWFPTLVPGTYTGQGQAAWSVSGNSRYIVYGGEFTHVNGVAQQGLVRFAVPSIAPNKSGPTVTAELTPTVSSMVSGQVRLSWMTTHDHDNANLTYTLVRDGVTGSPIYTATAYSNFYTLSRMEFVDSGLAPASTHSYRLYVSDGWGNTISRLSPTVTVAGTPGANQPPVARVTSSTAALVASFSGATSSDADGTISQYSWNFGDDTTGSGVTTSHAYAAAGTYTVTLTVRDDDGATASTSSAVTVTALPNTTVYGVDSFERTVTGGWGSATTGGAWSVAGAATALSVSGGGGLVALAPGSTRTMTLGSVATTTSDSIVSFSLDTAPTGGGSYTSIFGRQVGASNYAANVWIKSTGAVALVLKQGTTVLSNTVVPGITYTPGTQLTLRLQVTGTSPTTVQARVWRSGQPEPTTWTSSVTDSTAALQTPGSVAVQATLSATAAAGNVTRFDNFDARPPH